MAFPRLFPLNIGAPKNSAEVATDASTYFPVLRMAGGGEVMRALFVNGTASALTSGTTTGSSASVILYKNASSSASVIATFNGSGTTVGTLASATLLTSGTTGTVNGRFSAGDLLIGELAGGAATVVGAGAYILVAYVYGHQPGSSSAVSGPA